MVKTPHFQCRGQRFDPWLGNKDPTCHVVQLKKKLKSCRSTHGSEIPGDGDKKGQREEVYTMRTPGGRSLPDVISRIPRRLAEFSSM